MPPMRRPLLLAAALTLGTAAHATPHALTAPDLAAITALARAFFDSTRDGARDVQDVYPTAAELRALFAVGAPSGADGLVRRHMEAVERDVRALRERFRGGTFVGITPTSYRRNTVDLRPCGRFARATSQCGDGPVIEYTVGGETRRLRLDTLVRVRGRWRLFDVRL